MVKENSIRPFGSGFRAVSERFQSGSRAAPERFRSGSGAVSKQLEPLNGIDVASDNSPLLHNFTQVNLNENRITPRVIKRGKK